MEISRDALMRVVKASRAAMRLAEDMNRLMVDKAATWADEISWQLSDALGMFCGEILNMEDDFLEDSRTVSLLKDDQLSDGEVTDALIKLYVENYPKTCVRMVNREEMRKQAAAGYGYMAPEGALK